MNTTRKKPDRVNVSGADAATVPGRGAGIVADTAACYRALASHDSRFDGQFFVGVSSTRIYCRPVCRVRLPQKKNCTFFSSAPAAETAGFRPCLRCRPELAPGWSSTDISAQLAVSAARLIDDGLHRGDKIPDFAARLGVSDRHLRRVFEAKFGVTPVDYLQTQRLLLAKRLLTDTDMSVTDIASAAGFGSVRRLNASMRDRYRLNPTELRSKRQARPEPDGLLRFNLSVREPFDFDWICGYFASRAIDGLELVDANSYQRTVRVDGPSGPLTGWIQLSAKQAGQLELDISPSLALAVGPVFRLVRQLFDLDADPQTYLPVLGALGEKHPGLRVPGSASGFEIAVRAVLGQQITVKAARTLAQRFVLRFGEKISTNDHQFLTHSFPHPSRIAGAHLSSIAELGIISRRAQTIRQLAKSIRNEQLDLSGRASVEKTMAQLNQISGIGDWTAQYIAMRALRWPDAFPAADYGVMKALSVKTASQARHLAQPWRPWRAYGVMHLWASLH
ncbi:MAG: Ada metal-binding domain-containing protein [Burkholderiaceae bacterium]